jgi:hypothetical protein
MPDTPADEPNSKTEEVNLQSAAAKRFPGSITEKGTYLQRAGVSLFYWVLGFTTFICVALFAYLLIKTPGFPCPSGCATITDTTYVHMIAEQRALVFSNFLEAVSRLLLNLCLPLLTGILGYLFGQQKG